MKRKSQIQYWNWLSKIDSTNRIGQKRNIKHTFGSKASLFSARLSVAFWAWSLLSFSTIWGFNPFIFFLVLVWYYRGTKEWKSNKWLIDVFKMSKIGHEFLFLKGFFSTLRKKVFCFSLFPWISDNHGYSQRLAEKSMIFEIFYWCF